MRFYLFDGPLDGGTCNAPEDSTLVQLTPEDERADTWGTGYLYKRAGAYSMIFAGVARQEWDE